MLRTVLFSSVLVLALSAPPLMPAQQSPDNTLSGCLTDESGTYVVSEVPSGNTYRLTGHVAPLKGRRHQLVRLTGRRLTPATANQVGMFAVQSAQVLADTCAAPVPNQQAPQAVTGKTGVDATSIPKTTTATAGEVTPPEQTQAGKAQEPGSHPKPGQQNQPPPRGPLAPPQWGQVGQDQPTANRSAAAAERAEEEPSHTLGVNAMPSYANPAAPVGKPDTRGGAGVTTEKPAAPASGMQTPNPTGSTTQAAGATQGSSGTKAASGANTSSDRKATAARHHRRHAKKKNKKNATTPPNGATSGGGSNQAPPKQ